MLNLKEQLSDAEKENQRLAERLLDATKEIQRLTERMDSVSSNSPSSSLSIEAAMDPPFLGEYGMVEEYDGFYVPVNINGMEWMNLYM